MKLRVSFLWLAPILLLVIWLGVEKWRAMPRAEMRFNAGTFATVDEAERASIRLLNVKLQQYPNVKRYIVLRGIAGYEEMLDILYLRNDRLMIASSCLDGCSGYWYFNATKQHVAANAKRNGNLEDFKKLGLLNVAP